MTADRGCVDVLIVDDHGLLAQSLTFALRAEGVRVERSTEISSEAILEAVEAQRPDVVLLDLDLGEDAGTSLPLIAPIREFGSKVVTLTGVTDRVRLAECVEAGAIGIIPKSDAFEQLVAAVQQVVDDGSLLSRHERNELLAELRRHRDADRGRLRPFVDLTPREAQVLDALMDGRSPEQIATDWVVSLATVRSQVRSLRVKLGVNSQLAAVGMARKAGWSLETHQTRQRGK